AGQRVTDHHGVGAVGIERPVGLVGDLERRELDAGIELQRLPGAEARNKRVARIVGGGLARLVLVVQLSVDHLAPRRIGHPWPACSAETEEPRAAVGRDWYESLLMFSLISAAGTLTMPPPVPDDPDCRKLKGCRKVLAGISGGNVTSATYAGKTSC